MDSTNVCFRKFSNADVIAFIDGYICGPNCVMSYEHIGQHGEAHTDLLDELKPASPEEYADLLRELESVGYNVNVVDDIRSRS